jgi:hypothetical protein
VYLSFAALAASFVALLGLAGADAYALTQQVVPTIIMSLFQETQAVFVLSFRVHGITRRRVLYSTCGII